MSTEQYHSPRYRSTSRDAGAVGLAHELGAQPRTALIAQQRAITTAARQCPELWPLASLRWTLLVAELAARKRMCGAA